MIKMWKFKKKNITDTDKSLDKKYGNCLSGPQNINNSGSEEHAKSLDNKQMKFMSKLGLNDMNCHNLVRSQN
jgi:hypothetical protein